MCSKVIPVYFSANLSIFNTVMTIGMIWKLAIQEKGGHCWLQNKQEVSWNDSFK